MITTSLLVIFGLFGIYTWLCIVAAGVSLLRLLPNTSYTRHSLRLFTARWQVIQLLFVTALAGLWYIYGRGSTQQTVNKFVPTVGFILAVIIFQALLQLAAALRRLPTGFKAINIAYMLCSFMLPVSIAAAGIIGLTGANFWHAKVGWLLMLLTCLMTLAMAFSYIYYAVGRTPHDRLHQIARWLTSAVGVVSIVVFLALGEQHNKRLSLLIPILAAVLLIVLQFISWFTARERYMWWYLTTCAVTVPMILALANLPYVFYPTARAQNVMTVLRPGSKLLMLGVVLAVLGVVTRLLWPLSQTPQKP